MFLEEGVNARFEIRGLGPRDLIVMTFIYSLTLILPV